MQKLLENIKYAPKFITALGYLFLLIMALVLFFGRSFEVIRINTLLIVLPDFYNHISNFSISFLIYITVGYVGLMFGISTKQLIVIGLLILIVNLIFEFLIPILNTPDKTDAIYGIFGVLFALIFLSFAKKFGFNRQISDENQTNQH